MATTRYNTAQFVHSSMGDNIGDIADMLSYHIDRAPFEDGVKEELEAALHHLGKAIAFADDCPDYERSIRA